MFVTYKYQVTSTCFKGNFPRGFQNKRLEGQDFQNF